MDSELKQHEPENETPLEVSSAAEGTSQQDTSDRKDDDEEEEEEEEEDKIVEKSHNSRFHKRNKRFPKQIEGVDNAFIAIEPKSGKEVIWNECILSEKKTDKENRYLSIIKKLKKSSHPFLARFLDAWVSKSEDGSRKLVFITERLDECSLKQFLCNSAKNNRLWKRHVGQILSVLMFLHRLGITHGNLSKESIYYQNSGNLRVGPFALGGCLDHKSLSADIYALGVVALEIAIWTPTEFPQSLPLTERCQQMIAKLEDCSQRDFIEVCLDSNINARHKMKRLINHPAVTEVPILKLLSAKVIVENMKSLTNEDCPAAEQTGFTTLLKDYLSHYEDETIIVDVHFPHDNVVNSRSWKDFRSNFTLTSKFLEDFKNGFYPLFGCRWNWATDQEDDEESLVGGTATANGVSVSNISGGGLHRVESAAAPSLAHSTGTSTVPSACVSRKHSNVTRATDSIQGTHLVLESEKEILETKPAIGAQGGRSTSLGEYPGSRQPAVIGRVRQSDGSVGQFQVTMAGVLARKPSKDGSVRLPGASGTPAPSVPDGALSEVPLDSAGHSPPPVITKSGVSSSVEAPSGSVELPKMSGAQANVASLRRSVSPASCAPTADGSEKAALTASTDAGLHDMLSTVDLKPAVVGGASLTTEQLDTSALGVVREAGSLPDLSRITSAPEVQPADIPKRVTVTGTPLGSDAVKSARSDAGRNPEEEGGLDEEKEDEEEEEEEDEDDDDDEDEEEDDDEKKVVDTLERFEPQTVHVVAPERAPNHPALFTHCQYFYIGAGRWQVYVQMWFVEDRLKREAYVQVFDYEWHDYERVADLFEASRCLNPVDRPSLVRLLSLARHNCALIDGDLQFPGPLTTRPSNFDVFELHEKLTALRLHQQAREQLQRDSLNQDGGQAPDSTHDPSLSTSGLDTGQPSSLPAEKDSVPLITGHDGFDATDARPAAADDVPACADHVAQLQEHQRIQNHPGRVTTPPRVQPTAPTEPDPPKEPSRARVDVPGSTNTLFLDVGALAPRNAYCALCDTHEYLHHVDLPAYLISPCYHCREWLAREAKITPEILLDLHLRHSIPWPAFLQARFNLPPDGRSIEELIAYDCRWRSRQPCRCLVSSGGPLLPPCVEFPWLCPSASTTSWDVAAGSSGAPATQSSQPAVVSNNTAPAAEPNATEPVSTPLHSEASAAQTNEAITNVVPSESKQSVSESKAASGPAATQPEGNVATVTAVSGSSTSRSTLPCAHRHPRGAPTTCCHGIQFPLIGVTAGGTHCHQNQPVHNSPPTSQPETCPATAAATGHGATAPSNIGRTQPAPLVTNGVA